VADRVISLGYEFYGKVKGAKREVMEMITTVNTLKAILELLRRFVDVDENTAPPTISFTLPTGRASARMPETTWRY
jgi:hypothetical protein